jgi:hypothetical protein
MILLETHNCMLVDLIRQRFEASKYVAPIKAHWLICPLERVRLLIADWWCNERRNKDKREAVDIVIADFDSVTYHITNKSDARNLLTVSISWSAIHDIAPLGMVDRLKVIYGAMVVAPEPSYDFTIQFDLDNPSLNIGTSPSRSH